MNALGLLKVLVSLVSSIAQYMHDKQLLEAGAAQSVLKGLQDANEAIKRANSARDAARLSSDNPDDYR